MGNGVAAHGRFALNPRRFLLKGGGFGTDALDLHGHFLTGGDDLLDLLLETGKVVLRLRILGLRERNLVLLLLESLPGTLNGVQPKTDLQLLALCGKDDEFFRLFALYF